MNITFSVIAAFTMVLILLSIGEAVSIKSKAFVPSVFVTSILFLIGFWTVFPKDIMAKGSIGGGIVSISMYLLLVHMGTLMSVRELLAQWKIIVIAVLGIGGMSGVLLTVGKVIFGWQYVVAATPPLAGGVVASILMNKAAADKGLPVVAVLVTAVYVMQGFVGYPISSYCLKKESKRILDLFRKGEYHKKDNSTEKTVELRKKLIPPLPVQYQTPYIIIMKLAIVGWIASLIGPVVHINDFVVCLILGVIFCEVGFLEEKALIKADSFGFLMTILMAYIFSSLSQATPAMLGKIAVPLIGIIFLGVIGMLIVAFIMSKITDVSFPMAFACTLTALYGFPADYILTTEAVKSVCETDKEKEFLLGDMVPKMLVAGFTTVTITSVVLAGFFVKLL
ncbi:MAG: sodium/glutamate symporter [Clostridiaceae bacterium]|jgi:hypothetical protein|nr:sodium/glutamate symporter [Clostridiaceae bacterium]